MPPSATSVAEMLRRFGIANLRPAQQAALAALAAARDVLVILPTGGGKSLCYQLPAACGLSPAIVVSPLVALMKDQVDALRRRGVAAAQLSGAVSSAERDRAWGLLNEGALTLLYLAPEALASAATVRRLARAAPRLLAIYEAHCISEWGESFRPSYLALGAVRAQLGYPPTIALTATATPRTAREIVSRLALRDPLRVSGGFDRANLYLEVRAVDGEHARLTQLLTLARGAPGPAVVYAGTRRDTERLAGAYRRIGIAAAPFHAGLPTDERSRLQDRFLDNRVSTIVATNAFGMGVDKPDVRLVVHSVPPLTLEAYYQEAGRGGRDGKLAHCVLLLGPDDLKRARARILGGTVTPDLLARLVVLFEATRPQGVVGGEKGGVRLLAHALDVAPRDVEIALRLLAESGALVPAGGAGRLRVVATPARLHADRNIVSDDATALLRLMAEYPGSASDGAHLSMREIARIAPDGDASRFLQRIASRQLAVWRPSDLAWRMRHHPPYAVLEQLASRHATRSARDAWRHAQVARMVTATRCRRTVLLRYFGDAGPPGPCGACDVCGTLS